MLSISAKELLITGHQEVVVTVPTATNVQEITLQDAQQEVIITITRSHVLPVPQVSIALTLK
jgi:hypothetical protein